MFFFVSPPGKLERHGKSSFEHIGRQHLVNLGSLGINCSHISWGVVSSVLRLAPGMWWVLALPVARFWPRFGFKS